MVSPRARPTTPTGPATPSDTTSPSAVAPGLLLGAGLGAFVDGILLHQVLQWHHMLTSTDTDRAGVAYYPRDTVHGLEVNTLWDGLFHTLAWVLVIAGLAVLHSRVQHARGRLWASRALWGWVLVGWGAFNLVEGTLDHHLLGLHHVRSGPHQTAWDLSFLAVGLVLVAGGWALQRGARLTEPDRS